MSLAVVGSIAFDTVATPFGGVERELGGAATHAALAASFFTDVAVVAAVGEDFSREHEEVLGRRGVGTSGIERRPGRTLNWSVRYDLDLALPQPQSLDLGVFAGWSPKLTDRAASAEILFLAAMDPVTQLEVRSQWHGERWVALDTMTYWIETSREALIEAIRASDIVLLNDQEARGLTGKPMLAQAAREIRSWGPRVVVIKFGEYGCSLLSAEGYFALPGYPLESGMDPTGTGDSFAGGFLGYLDRVPKAELNGQTMRRALTYGSVMASFCIEEFGTRRVAALSDREVDSRFDGFRNMTHFEHVPLKERPRPGSAGAEHEQMERPHGTPSTRGWDSPQRTPGTQQPESQGRTPSTETLRPATKPPEGR